MICCVLVAVLLISMSVMLVSAAEETVILSELSDSECIAFIKEHGVEIPDDYEDELSWAPFVKYTIACVEENPSVVFAYNYPVTRDFANAIKDVVNAYYETQNIWSAYAIEHDPNYVLQESIVHGAWVDEFEEYNCYAYAINETDDWLCPGDLSGFVYTVSLSVYTVAQYVKADLEELGYVNVTICETMPETANIGIHEKVICVRIKGGVDFHFMKLDGDAWYHKPSYTNTLKYNHIPSEGRNWNNECSYRGEEYEPTLEYTSAIRYIVYSDPHTWSYAYYGSGQHIKTCEVCGELDSAEACTKEYVHSYDDTLGDVHEEICTVCNHVYTAQESCEFAYTDNEDGTHAAQCVDCDVLYDIDCDYEYTYTGDGLLQNTHTIECPDCDHSEEVNCTFTYQYSGRVDGNNTHTYTCTGCGHNRIGVTACTYNSSGYCRFCGVHQSFVPYNGMKEEILEA